MEQGKPDGGSFTGTSCFSDRGSCVVKIVDLYRLHGMLTVSLQESARYLSVCAYAVDETGKETYEIPETAACIAYAEAKIPKEIRENGMVTLAGSRVKMDGWN